MLVSTVMETGSRQLTDVTDALVIRMGLGLYEPGL